MDILFEIPKAFRKRTTEAKGKIERMSELARKEFQS